jgi:GTP-binding protein LepA
LVLTAPSVQYVFVLRDGTQLVIDNPAKHPDPTQIAEVREPYIRASIILPEQYLGTVITLCIDRRGVQKDINYLDSKRVELTFDLPLAEILFDFYDKLKSTSKGYASFDYDFLGYRPTDLVKVDILVAGEKVDALSMLVHKDRAYQRARRACERLKKEIPRQLFKVPIQGAIGGKIISRETVSALRKDVTAKCYGGDITRKKKLLEKQKEGKKRMKQVGNVAIPQSAFLAVLKTDEDE